MNNHLQNIIDSLEENQALDADQKEVILKSMKKANREMDILSFKLERTEKVKRTTAILLEETISELEIKRKDIERANNALKKSLSELQAAQAQLIQSEKMASLGELTAGIAHEIQNPLNFVNNFSEISQELLEELQEELASGNLEEVDEIVNDVITNLGKITHHGKRADNIVKGMLMHSRKSDGKKIETDLNALAEEYLRLAYHGIRAKNRNFNAEFEMNFDPELPRIKVVQQDIGRVILNIVNNAFQALSEFPVHGRTDKLTIQDSSQTYSKDVIDRPDLNQLKGNIPKVKITTTYVRSNDGKDHDKVTITISDNGPGIPDEIKDKIFQPFFTTKPTGHGTGLGLSLSYDIVKAHGGSIEVISEKLKGTEFKINIPI